MLPVPQTRSNLRSLASLVLRPQPSSRGRLSEGVAVLRCCGVAVLAAHPAPNSATPQHRNTVPMSFPEHELAFFSPHAADPPETYGETIVAVSQVLIEDNGEQLVDPRELDARIDFAAEHPWTRFPRTPWVREAVGRMLATAQEALGAGLRLQIIEGYRPLDVQRTLFLYACEQLRRRHPDWSEEHLRE